MALNWFRKQHIEKMDVNDIPEEFINYFESLDDNGKASLIGLRPDLAKALGFVLPETGKEKGVDVLESEPKTGETSVNTHESVSIEEAILDDTGEDEETADELDQIRQNYYEGKDLDIILKNNMPELEALAIPDGTKNCMLHRNPLESKQIYYRNPMTKPTYGIVLKVCRACHRVYLEESKMAGIHKALVDRGVPHTFYDWELTSRYLQSQMQLYEFSAEDILQIPDIWVEEDPRCPIHGESLYEVSCLKRYKDREIHFTGYRCDLCGKYLMRRAAALDLKDRCAETGIPQIETERLIKKAPPKKPLPPMEIKSDYLIENGRRTEFRYNIKSNCYQLSENDIVVVSDSIYCTIDGHDDTEEVVAFICVLQKKDGKKGYLFHLGYCTHCQKYYMAQEDYKALYKIGRPEVIILHDIDDTDYQITSGEVFNLERNHLVRVEKQISDEVTTIKSSPDYVNPYAIGVDLAFAKTVSINKYGDRLKKLSEYAPKPYSYRVDISLDGITETYYIGAADIFLDGKKQVISANDDFGHALIHYQTVKIKKQGKEYSVKLSRQFEINNAALYGYVNLRTDEDIIFKSGITDPFLVRVLNMRKRQHYLTDIFVTIQENQNSIVNRPFSKNIIVQGCAGSGKTMVLLHRLSSLNYKERGFNFSRDALILTPNDQFTMHIKGLAEELQIGSIQRASVEQYYIDTLLRYSPDFKPDGKVSSEMIVRQGFVDYIYSDQFRADFDKAYKAIIEKRNTLVLTLNDLVNAMGQRERNIDLSDDSKVARQIQYAVDSLRDIAERKESEIQGLIEQHQKHIDRKQHLQERLQSVKATSASVMAESRSRVYSKIGAHLSVRQHTISGLQEQLEGLTSERDSVQKHSIPFGKREKIEELDRQIRSVKRKLNTENKRQDEELPILSQYTDGLSDDEALDWMRQVLLIVPEVRDEIRLCDNIREETQKLTEELVGIDTIIETVTSRKEEAQATRYSDEVKRSIIYLSSETQKYSMLNTYQLVFDQATTPFREAHKISNIQGKYHRYDLYAKLLFAMRYYGQSLGNTLFMCIDEGQDLAFNEYRLLYELNQHRVIFNIFGDTYQLIKLGRGISDWSELRKVFGAEIYSLNENYRNTNQITRFCNSSFDLKVTQTGVDGVNVREIPRKELERELAALNITSERIAVLVPRVVQKNKYLKSELLPSTITKIIGEKMGNGFIALMYVDEVKGIEFDKVYVVGNKMSRNEKYIAYTRALSELILVVDDQVADYGDMSSQETVSQTQSPKVQPVAKKKNNKKGVLNYRVGQKKEATAVMTEKVTDGSKTEQADSNKSPVADTEEKDVGST